MIIRKYLTREVGNALMAITVILVLAFLSQQLVRYFNYVAIGKIPTSVVVALISFEIPYLLALLLPLSLYLSILLAYGKLYTNNEMHIMQMCGYSDFKIFKLTFAMGVVVAFFVLFLMLWINPIISAKRQVLMTSDEATVHLVQTMIPGRFEVSADGKHVIYVEKISGDDKRAENVFLAQQKKNPQAKEQYLWTLLFAKEGYQTRDEISKEPFFVTKEGYRYEGTPGENDYKMIRYRRYAIRIPTNDKNITHQENEAKSSTELWRSYRSPKEAAELQWRVSIGIATLLLGLLAVPLATISPRSGRYLIFIPAILVYIVYINLLFIARHWIELEKTSIKVGMWWVHAIMAAIVVIAFWLNRYKRIADG